MALHRLVAFLKATKPNLLQISFNSALHYGSNPRPQRPQNDNEDRVPETLLLYEDYHLD